MLVATRALRISSGFVGLARLTASMSTVKPVSARGHLRDVAIARIVLLLLEELVDLPDEWLLGLEIEGEERVRVTPMTTSLGALAGAGGARTRREARARDSGPITRRIRESPYGSMGPAGRR